MRKLKLFIENFLIYGLGGIINKIIPLIMIPIITRMMPETSFYGISDMSNTIISFASSLGVMGMYDSMYRMFFERNDREYKREICSTAMAITLLTSFAVFLIMILLKKVIAQYIFGDYKYVQLVYITAIATLVGSTNSIIAAPTRMQNQKIKYLSINILSSVLSYSISIPLLLRGYYIIALPIAGLVASATVEILFGFLNRDWFKRSSVKKEHIIPLLKIAVPLLPNFLIYWVFNSSDKLMITNILGMDQTGIYSVGSKLGQVSQLIYTAFSGGWQYFAFSTMKDKDQVKVNSIIFEYLGIISFMTSMFVCAWSSLIFKTLFEIEYFSGYIIAPYLFLAPLLQMLFQVASNQFIVIKKTWPNFFILLLGALSNVILNLFLIPVIGIEGAAIATLIGYIISDIIVVGVLGKMKLMKISKRFVLSCFLLAIYFIIWRIFFSNNTIWATIIAIIFSIGIAVLYKNDVKLILKGLKTKGRK